MKRAIALIVGVLGSVAMSQTADAQLATNWLWTVPGVSDNGASKTYVGCTNNGSVAATVGVQVYGSNGSTLNSVAATELTLNPNETRLFASTGGGAFVADSILSTGLFQVGSAQILASVTKRINCSAWVTIGTSISSLAVVKKNTQKGQ
jgi:hypothetical protein